MSSDISLLIYPVTVCRPIGSASAYASAIEINVRVRGCGKSGGTRRRILPDFLIGAHAVARADRLLTRDRGFYRSHFTRLTILEP